MTGGPDDWGGTWQYVHAPRRGDDVERWLAEWRSQLDGEAETAVDAMLDEYRLAADTGARLGTVVRERDDEPS